MHIEFVLVIIAIVLAFAFDFLNGFHDAANSIATIVSTRVLKPHWAVLWAASFNFAAFFFFGVKVASMIGVGLLDPSIINVKLVLSALLAAIIWNIITWYYGIPSSSSHALIGGMIGAGIAEAGLSHIQWWGVSKIVLAIVISPVLGMIMGLILMAILMAVFAKKSPYQVDSWFRRLQLVSSAMISLGHGGNDAQKTMGVIAVLLYSSGMIGSHFYVPNWVVFSCYLVISLGTLFGGWRIIRTMGMKITKLKPISGFCAETASACTIFMATAAGIPVSTTHTITGSIVGVGATNRISAVRWGVARNIVWAWVFTIPAAAVLAAGVWFLVN